MIDIVVGGLILAGLVALARTAYTDHDLFDKLFYIILVVIFSVMVIGFTWNMGIDIFYNDISTTLNKSGIKDSSAILDLINPIRANMEKYNSNIFGGVGFLFFYMFFLAWLSSHQENKKIKDKQRTAQE